MSWSRRLAVARSPCTRSRDVRYVLVLGLPPLVLRSRVSGVENLTKPLLADVSVVLCGRQIGVTEQLLHGSQVGTTVEQVRREGVAQRMRVGGRRRTTIDDATNVPRGEAMTSAIEEDGLVRRRRPHEALGGPVRATRASASTDGSLIGTTRCLLPLPHTAHRAARRGRGRRRSRPQSSPARSPLPYSNSSTASSLARTAGSSSRCRVVTSWFVEQGRHLVAAQDARQPSIARRRGEVRRG